MHPHTPFKLPIAAHVAFMAESYEKISKLTRHSGAYTNKKEQLLHRNRLFPYCPQDRSFIPKWPYISALKNRDKHNLPLLLHLISEPFCSVSQSRVPTFLHKGGEII